jgi:hypothetical protein
MKKIIVAAATALGFLNGLMAQDSATDLREKLMFGLKGGVNYSNVYDSKGEQFQADPKLGMAAGVFLAIPIGRFLGIQPEALFSQKGFKADGVILGTTYKLTRTSNYFDFPLFFALKPSEFVTLLAGPQFSYLVKQTDSFANTTTTIAQETEFQNENIRKNTLSIAAGVDLTMKHLVVSVRAGWDVQQNRGDGTSTTPRYKNAWYQATLGYRLY